MRYLRFLPLVALFFAAACDEAGDVTNTKRPPLAFIRYVNAVPDAGALDFLFVDGNVEYSPQYPASAFRTIGIYQGARAGTRRMRVFPNSTNINVTSVPLIDTTFTLVAGQYYTILHAGFSVDANGTPDRLVFVDDTRPAQNAGLHVSMLNAAQGLANMDVFATATDATPLAGETPLATNVAVGTRTTYFARATGAFAIQAAPTATTTAAASMASAAGTAGTLAADPVGGNSVAGTQFTAFLFPRSVAGSAAPNLPTPAITIVVDRQPPRTVPD